MIWFIWYNWVNPSNSYTTWTIPGTHKVIGGVFVLIVLSFLLGVVLLVIYRFVRPTSSSARRSTAIRQPGCPTTSDPGRPFGIEPLPTR